MTSLLTRRGPNMFPSLSARWRLTRWWTAPAVGDAPIKATGLPILQRSPLTAGRSGNRELTFVVLSGADFHMMTCHGVPLVGEDWSDHAVPERGGAGSLQLEGFVRLVLVSSAKGPRW